VTRESHHPGNDLPPRERILDAAMKLFADRGYSATPIKAIARACDMSDAGVFHYFATKRDILEAILDRPHQPMRAQVTDEPVRDSHTLDRLVLRTLDSAHVNEPILRVLIRQQLVGDPEALVARDMALSSWRDALRVWFAEYHPDDIEIMVEAFVNSLMGWLFLMQVRHGSQIVDLLLDERVRDEACAHVRRSVPLERFSLRDRKPWRSANEGVS
jgi:AcrR family transcriptional regulator